MPVPLIILAEIALVLYILFGYLLTWIPTDPPQPKWMVALVSILVIIIVLLLNRSIL